MSTVSKEIADRVIAGEFPEDSVIAIIKYKNVFNGDDAYKLVYSSQRPEVVAESIYCTERPTIYWERN